MRPILSLCFICLLLYSNLAMTETTIYHQSNNGVSEFSDQPMPNNKPLPLMKPLPVVSPPPSQDKKTAHYKVSEITQIEILPALSVSISSPVNNSQAGFDDEWLYIYATVQPQWDPQNYQLQLWDHDTPVGSPQQEEQFKIHWLARGTHIFKIQLKDTRTNTIVAESKPVTVYQQRPRLKNEIPLEPN
jgi:hypothetical protein